MKENNYLNYNFSEKNSFASVSIGVFFVDIQLIYAGFRDRLVNLISNEKFEKVITNISHILIEKGYNKELYLSILLTDNNYIKQINKKFRKKTSPTNIISFPSDDFNYHKFTNNKQQGISLHFGDIIISLEKILSESKEKNKNFKNHFYHILLHGLLHLLGYDHNDEESANNMENLEISILNSIGIDNPY